MKKTCVDCGSSFVFTTGEQEFYFYMGFHSPKRCPDCRQHRRTARLDPFFGFEETMRAPATRKRRQHVHYRPFTMYGLH